MSKLLFVLHWLVNMELTFHSRWLVGGVELVVYVLGIALLRKKLIRTHSTMLFFFFPFKFASIVYSVCVA